MDSNEFRRYGHEIVEWIARYFENVEQYPVKSGVRPGEIKNALPELPPSGSESFDLFMKDFDEVIMPGITHWQSPNFFAYFPANSSPPSVLAEMLTAALGAQCMLWETSPAGTELEERMMEWLRSMMGIPPEFEGVIQDSASSSTLAALITAREKVTRYRSNREGLSDTGRMRIYVSGQTHSSVEKGAGIAGFGRDNLVRVEVRSDFSMDPEALERAIERDIASGYIPCCAIATLGTTGVTAIDPLRAMGEICRKHGIWLHVDAAIGGTALLLPEMRWMADGIEYADSLVFNPHKWMFTNFDCSVYFVRDAASLIRSFEILPEYLKTRTRGEVNDYRDWGIPLGRRFRALKLWAVIRSYGVEGLQSLIREHLRLAKMLAGLIEADRDFRLMAPVTLNTLCFRYCPAGMGDEDANTLNEKINHALNDTGKIYLTHTKVDGRYVLRMVTAQTGVTERHVRQAWDLIRETASALSSQNGAVDVD
ncbi:MAG TPA: pyridoxal-dependent decarboxylase [Bacteroidales bacterium]|jgi:aromatic-L-amino-acid decarboxylase|nr:aspartate aminotransferase family protein [Bacteroidales bacterium]MDI9533401.1 pyridoxal-dependent decarboxylase [Bacteroidota bacterium]MBP7035886.1 aspartate aminotransferase family protein [Bacteroidales bacterium]MBP8709163.1 aspartate aminotransferase family protein [Bacteroidales bacterium]MZQ78942.1 aspartate aminotransferase family protein [Bacteroidales bacterium]